MVLVNRGTYGPAELTAAAIEDVEARRCGGRAQLWRRLGAEDDRTARRRGAAADRGQVREPRGKKIQDEAVTPTVAVGMRRPIDEEDEGAPPAQER